MDNPSQPQSQSSWDKCLWCICTCSGTRVNRVTPADAPPVVPLDLNLKDAKKKIPVQKEPSRSNDFQLGVVNQFFVPDDEDHPQGESNNAHNHVFPLPKGSSEYQLKNSLFIEIDKERRIRVVHLQIKEEIENTNANASNSAEDAEKSPEVVQVSPPRKSVVEEEDEYWFTKWTRKPRFRSIFEKNTIHCEAEDDDQEKENNNSDTVNSKEDGTLSKDFEIARAQAAAKRRAWAYNNEAGCDVVVQKCTNTVIDNDEEEFNSITLCENVQKWSKNGSKTDDGSLAITSTNTPPNTPRHSAQSTGSLTFSSGITNPSFEDDDPQIIIRDEDGEVIHEMAVDCPPDFVSPVKSLSLKRERSGPSPSPSSSSTIVMSGEKKKKDSGKEDITIIRVKEEGESSSSSSSPSSSVKVKRTPVIFFIHGISESCEIWKAQIDFFHNLGYEIIAPDVLGHGFSSTPGNSKYYHFESLIQDLLSVYDYFVQEGQKAVIIGHGYGACLAAVISRVRPKTASLYISISGGGPTPLVNRSCCRGSLIPFYCRLFHTGINSGRFDNPDIRHVLPAGIRRNVLNGQVWGDGDSAFYRRITVPTLLVYGMKDKVVNLVEVCEMERTIPKSFLEVIDSAGHMVMVDEPAKLNKMLGKFVQSWL